MSRSSAGTLLRHSSAPTEKRGPLFPPLQEVPKKTQEETAPSPSLYCLGQYPSMPVQEGQIGNIASRMAHDLTNILTAIQSNTELATLNLPEHSPLQKNLHNILAASQRGQECLEQLLNERPHQNASHEPLDFRILLDEALEIFQATLPSNITLEKISRLPTANIMGHATQLFRMVSNLLSNAVRAMSGQKHGTLTIILDKVLETDRLPTPNRSGIAYWKLMIRDTGFGMSAGLCGRIFDPCFTTCQDGKGLGLGLAIVKEVVTDHDGLITVESKPHCGSLFTVYFPQYSPLRPQAALSNQLVS